jgi:hypothetical protein
MRRIYGIALLLALFAAACWVAVVLAGTWSEILRGERAVRYPDLLGTVAVLLTPFLIVYLVRFERRIGIAGRAQHEALGRLFPGTVMFTTQAFPETVATLGNIRRFSASQAPQLKADHRALTVTVTPSDLSVWDGLDAPRRIAMIPTAEIASIGYAEIPVLAGLSKSRIVPAVEVRSHTGGSLLLPVLLVWPRTVKPTPDDVRAIVASASSRLQPAYR